MIKATQNRLLIKPIRSSEYSDAGVYVPRATTSFVTGKDKTEQVTVGEVVSVGPGKRNKAGRVIPVEASIGDVVTFSDTCGQPVTHEGEDYLFIREDDIAGFVDEGTKVEIMYA